MVMHLLAVSLLAASVVPWMTAPRAQGSRVATLTASLGAPEADSRGRAACDLRELGDSAAPAISSLVALLADGATKMTRRAPASSPPARSWPSGRRRIRRS